MCHFVVHAVTRWVIRWWIVNLLSKIVAGPVVNLTHSSSLPMVGSFEDGCPKLDDGITGQCLGFVKAHARVEIALESHLQKS
jgi:hypothetical protein